MGTTHTHPACLRRALACALALALLAAIVEGQLSRPEDEHRRGAHFPERGLPVLASPRGTCVRTSWGVSDPLRSRRGVRFALRGGGVSRSRPGTDVDRPARRLRRHRAPPIFGRSCTCMPVLRDELQLSILRLRFKLQVEESRRHAKQGGRLRSEPSAPLSAPSHVEGGQLRFR